MVHHDITMIERSIQWRIAKWHQTFDFLASPSLQGEYIWEQCKPESGFVSLTPEQRKDQLVAFDHHAILGAFRVQLCAANHSNVLNLPEIIQKTRSGLPMVSDAVFDRVQLEVFAG